MSSSSDLGASLLADVRQRNDQREKAARKRAKRNAWKKLGVEVLIGAADSMLQNRQEEFLTNEDNMRAKLSIGTANKNATEIFNTEQAAKAFNGGREAYWTEKAKPMVEDYLQKEYAAGTYNESDYNKFVKNLSSKYGQELSKTHNERLEIATNFLNTTGGGDAVTDFNNSLKRQKGSGIKGYVAELLNRGIPESLKDDTATLSSRMVTNAETFQKAYDETGNAALSEFISKNKLLENVDLGDPTPQLGNAQKIKNHVTGEEQIVIPVIQKKKDGSVSISTINATNNGLTITKSDVSMAETTFSSIVNNAVADRSSSPIIAAGMTAMEGLTEDENTKFQNYIVDRLTKGRGKTMTQSSKHFDSAVKLAKDRYYANVGAAAYVLQKEGFGAFSSSAIANELALNSLDYPVNKVFSSAGSSNPWHTLHATHGAVTKKKINIPSTMQSTLITDNSLNLLRAYRSETTAGQAAIDKMLADNDYFVQLGVDEILKPAHLAIQKIVKNPQEFAGMSDAQALEAAIK